MKKNLLMRFRSVRTSIVVSFGALVAFALFTYFIISLQYTQSTVLEFHGIYLPADRSGQQ